MSENVERFENALTRFVDAKHAAARTEIAMLRRHSGVAPKDVENAQNAAARLCAEATLYGIAAMIEILKGMR